MEARSVRRKVGEARKILQAPRPKLLAIEQFNAIRNLFFRMRVGTSAKENYICSPNKTSHEKNISTIAAKTTQ